MNFKKKEGVARGPEVIRAAGLVDELKILGKSMQQYIYLLHKHKYI